MNAPLRTALARAARSTPSSLASTQLRRYSQQQHRPSATVGPPESQGAFYKTFTRPVAKCALLAVFVYQLAYFGWTKLEADEIKEERQGE
ncbi:hypothetical protein NEMBOFW57_005401 [Staphylotrichum longicolle]|uniref:Uncharacterized protein n=1 Tax=Staphylotrichum longicolle TaxID=669026 RepID=A0AAD4EXM8_9PEZI|nr:hypothetical protein NEMBOFW57_005401 [Staphylotrichum longicolle]